MSTHGNNKDVFAEIAAQRVILGNAALIEPQPPKLADKILSLDNPDAKTSFRPAGKLDTPQKLQRELERQRRKHEKFLKNLAPAPEKTRVTVPLETFDWRIETEQDRSDFAHTLSGQGTWEPVQIPHYGAPLGRAVTYYRTHFEVTTAMMNQGALFLHFKGVDYKAHLFVNGAYLDSHEGFFAPFEVEFTAHAQPGENTLLVKVENDAICMGNTSWGEDGQLFEGDKIYAATGPGYDDPEVGWHHCPPGMGIYQDVVVEARASLHIHDIFVRPLTEENRAEAWIEIRNCDKYRQNIGLNLSVYGQNFRTTVFRYRSFDISQELGPGINYLRLSFDMPTDRLWKLDSPWLYQLQVKLTDENGLLQDTAARQFGMRSFHMDQENEPKGRMYLNNREIRLRGANTMGHLQQCVIKKDWDQLRDDILLAKICNMNFLRLTQRPVQPEIYEYCDRLGMMTQTDLPLFGVLRRNQLCEAVRQAEEMERLVRAHPCAIMVSYINEPFPNAMEKPQRYLTRTELEAFFRAASELIRLQNPERVIKPVDGDYDPPADGLPDNHCYCGWYNGHGLDLGRLHKGYWQHVKPGWMVGCGEFGAEGLDPVNLMRKYYPEEWMPQSAEEEATWTPDKIIKAQTGRFHYMWFETQHCPADWVAASQSHQAWITRLMTEAFRRNNGMNTFAIHLFIDAFPSGWMKTIMDFERQPKPAYFVYREILTPLMVNLRTDRRAFFSGEETTLEAWICNDTNEVPRNASLRYHIEMDKKVLQAGATEATIQPYASTFQGRLRFRVPEVSKRSQITVRLALIDADDHVLHDTAVSLDVFEPVGEMDRGGVRIIGSRTGKAAQLARELGLKRIFSGRIRGNEVLLMDDFAAFRRLRKPITEAVRKGACAIFIELPAGIHHIAETDVKIEDCGMGAVHFVSRDTAHPLVKEFAADDFKFWYDQTTDYPTPLLSTTFEATDWEAILKSGNGSWSGEWNPAFAAAEKRDGQGVWRICQLHLSGRTEGNPVARIFAGRLLGIK